MPCAPQHQAALILLPGVPSSGACSTPGTRDWAHGHKPSESSRSAGCQGQGYVKWTCGDRGSVLPHVLRWSQVCGCMVGDFLEQAPSVGRGFLQHAQGGGHESLLSPVCSKLLVPVRHMTWVHGFVACSTGSCTAGTSSHVLDGGFFKHLISEVHATSCRQQWIDVACILHINVDAVPALCSACCARARVRG